MVEQASAVICWLAVIGERHRVGRGGERRFLGAMRRRSAAGQVPTAARVMNSRWRPTKVGG